MSGKRGRRLPHTTLIEPATRADKALRAVGLVPYPGIIDPRGGSRGGARAIVVVEAGRVRVTVSGAGVQELLIYGPVPADTVLTALRSEFGEGKVSLRDPAKLWADRTDQEA